MLDWLSRGDAGVNEPFRCEVVYGTGNFMKLKADWDRLLERSRSIARPFLTHDWTRNWLEFFGPKCEPVIILVYLGERIVGLAPLCHRPNPYIGPLWTTLSFLGDPGADYHDFIIDETVDYTRMYEYILGIVRNMAKRYSVARLYNVHSEVASLFAKGLPNGVTVHPTRCLYVDTRQSWDSYHNDILTKKMRYALKRASKVGPIRYSVASNESEINPFMQALFDMHKRRWGATKTPSAFRSARYQTVLLNLAHEFMRESRIHLSYLSIGGEIAACTYSVRDPERNRLYGYLNAWNPGLARLSPGILMIYFLIRNEYDRYEVIDFMNGENEYKNHWANKETQSYTFRLYKTPMHKAIYTRLRTMVDKKAGNVRSLGG
ncbi:GNAT family N-acetyltransferase [Sulfobacillus harzensis]|uniref:GNAT family N-acetyltransferase n=1 Tax=Sulfobacillus harzensis TaxID=2729629 RepID=A0A7Y0L7M5_9FIRM|nr:GNAT family N-acetyltransferase [Sulfobacillus harzensis]NMP24807.1 GNAT family N-acetyltransferase [Sulfobacillus harzensis]